MSFSKTNPRFCPKCRLAKIHCVCEYFELFDNDNHLWLFQDPREKKKKNNTGYWATQFLSNYSYEDENLDGLFSKLNKINPEKVGILLPHNNSIELNEKNWGNRSELVVLDGTWSHVQKLLKIYDFDENHQFYHISGLKSSFEIRKPPFEGAISTLNAISHFYKTIENFEELEIKVQSLLQNRIKIWKNAKVKKKD